MNPHPEDLKVTSPDSTAWQILRARSQELALPLQLSKSDAAELRAELADDPPHFVAALFSTGAEVIRDCQDVIRAWNYAERFEQNAGSGVLLGYTNGQLRRLNRLTLQDFMVDHLPPHYLMQVYPGFIEIVAFPGQTRTIAVEDDASVLLMQRLAVISHFAEVTESVEACHHLQHELHRLYTQSQQAETSHHQTKPPSRWTDPFHFPHQPGTTEPATPAPVRPPARTMPPGFPVFRGDP